MKTYKGKIITETLRKNLELTIRKYYQEKGRLNAKTKSTIKTDSMRGNNAILHVVVDKGEKVKVNKIIINGIDEKYRSLIAVPDDLISPAASVGGLERVSRGEFKGCLDDIVVTVKKL